MELYRNGLGLARRRHPSLQSKNLKRLAVAQPSQTVRQSGAGVARLFGEAAAAHAAGDCAWRIWEAEGDDESSDFAGLVRREVG